MNRAHDSIHVAELTRNGTPFTLGVIGMEDFKQHSGDILALRREKKMVLNLVSSDGSVTALLPLSCLAWLRESDRHDGVPHN